MSAHRNDLLETIEGKTRVASVPMDANIWLQSNGAGEFEPLNPGNPVVGLLLEAVLASDPNIAVEGLVHVDLVSSTIDRFLMDVGAGAATSEMEGLSFDVTGANSGELNVAAPGSQFEITRFIKADLVEVKVISCCDLPIS